MSPPDSSQVFKGPGLVHGYSPATALLVALARTTVFLCLIWYPSTKTCLSTLWSFTLASHTTTCPGSLVTTQSTFPHSHLPQNLSKCLICLPSPPQTSTFPNHLVHTQPGPSNSYQPIPLWLLNLSYLLGSSAQELPPTLTQKLYNLGPVI